VRLKACFDPLTDSFSYFRNLKCITPVILDHIEKEWKVTGHGDNLLDFAQNQPEEVLRMFLNPGDPVAPLPTAKVSPMTPALLLQCAENLTNHLRACAEGEAARRKAEHAEEKAVEGALEQAVAATATEGRSLGKRKR
jgi:hypothetical protein